MVGLAIMAVKLGLFALVLVLLNARDRRRDRAIGAVLGACPVMWQGSIALSARAPLLRRHAVVTVDLSACDDLEVWSTARQLATGLPPRVALVVRARLGPARPAAISVRAWDVYRARAS